MIQVALEDEEQAKQTMARVFRAIRQRLVDGKRLWLTVKDETRTLPMNAKFHAICTDLAKSQVQWAGKRRSVAQWKVLLVSGHAAATKEEFEIIPGLEGEFVNVRESTALMSVSRGCSLIEYATAFCVENEVKLSDPEDWMEWGLR